MNSDDISAEFVLTSSMPLLEVQNLCTWFPVQGGVFRRKVGDIRAVDDVSFSIKAGQTVGLVGESGSGKTTVGRTILKLIPATGGEVLSADIGDEFLEGLGEEGFAEGSAAFVPDHRGVAAEEIPEPGEGEDFGGFAGVDVGFAVAFAGEGEEVEDAVGRAPGGGDGGGRVFESKPGEDSARAEVSL